jgi:uncharacterized protein DUF6920
MDILWEGAGSASRPFDPATLSHLPEPARRYLVHAVAPDTCPTGAVRLRMHGRIKIGAWKPFRAEQLLHADHGLIWRARVGRGLLAARGFDAWLDGRGAMQWKIAGLIPIVRATGPDVDRSGAGRFHAESVWLPDTLLPSFSGVEWSLEDEDQPVALLASHGATSRLHFHIGPEGRLEALTLERWGNPGGGAFAIHPFSVMVEKEASFQGRTIPVRLRAAWAPLGEAFEAGEFFQAILDSVEYPERA